MQFRYFLSSALQREHPAPQKTKIHFFNVSFYHFWPWFGIRIHGTGTKTSYRFLKEKGTRYSLENAYLADGKFLILHLRDNPKVLQLNKGQIVILKIKKAYSMVH